MAETTEFRISGPLMAPPIPILRERERDTRRKFDFGLIRIGLASPETIRSWSHGEVTKPETINYRTFRPERDGLFCERIFGPVKDWQCACGRYKMIRYRGVICDKCGVEVTRSSVRRDRMAHIALAVPVSHIWYFKGVPSRIGHLLDMPVRQLERILYYESYVMIDPGNTPYKAKELITEEQYHELLEDGSYRFEAKMGAEAIREQLRRLDLDQLSEELRGRARTENSVQRKKDVLKRLKVVQAFRQSNNKPEWMILEVVPVLPPDLRPLVPLEGGRFATSDLNDLYRRVINRNNRLKRLVEIRAPEVILRNEKRMLQEAVDALFDNGRRTRAVRGQGNRPLKSLSDMLKGKQGRFRQNLLGKRVDYSGRSVIVVGPELRLHECGLPQTMALELFKPFIIQRLEAAGETVKHAKRLVERESPQVWEILSEIVKEHPVLLNRAPTLHRLGIQAFQPVLVEGKAIRIHPLVCTAFNADFDGDQMAVHVPLSWAAQIESRELMMSTNNIMLPANGRPVATPTQDIVLGCNYLTKPRDGARGEGKIFADPQEVMMALEHKQIDLHARIRCRVRGELLETTAGRVVFNQIVPEELGYYNETFGKKQLERLVANSFHQLGKERTARFLDQLKDFGFTYATQAGITVGIDDILIPDEKMKIIAEAETEVNRINRQHRDGVISERERQNRVVETWTKVTNQVEKVTMEGLARSGQGFNPIWMMADSGSRGSREQIRQLAGMRGLMAKPQKRLTGGAEEVIEQPVLRNFKEGLTVLEYFISTHGARKGLADTALKTADAGYLTRRLVDVAQDVIVTETDCGTIRGIERGALKDGEQIVEPLSDRVLGRVTVDDVYDAHDEERLIAESGTLIDEEIAESIELSGVDKVMIRSVLTCEARRGICAKCYGRDLSSGNLVSIGEAVGVIAAQSIGEPGTQLTLRTFHIGGIAALEVGASTVRARREATVRYVGLKVIGRQDGTSVHVGHQGEVELIDDQGRVVDRFRPAYGTILRFVDGARVAKDDVIFEWDTYNIPIVALATGKVQFVDIKEKVTLRDETDEATGKRELVVVEDRERKLQPHIDIIPTKGAGGTQRSPIPTGARLVVRDGQKVEAGDVMATLPRTSGKSRDITAGLPRVAELFEARRPKDQATISEIDGVVRLGDLSRGMRRVIVEAQDGGDQREYLIPHGKHLHVHDGDFVRAGDALTDGRINPHDILRVRGIKEVQEYLVDEIQEVYRTQGVGIDDKHIEVIVRQMLQKVRIEDPGDSRFLEGEVADKNILKDEQERVVDEGGNPARFAPLLLGITKASLSTNSFVSAASFQETTRILTEASINGSTDPLRGLKENVAIGKLIPAGTGMPKLRKLKSVALDAQPEEEEIDLLLDLPSILDAPYEPGDDLEELAEGGEAEEGPVSGEAGPGPKAGIPPEGEGLDEELEDAGEAEEDDLDDLDEIEDDLEEPGEDDLPEEENLPADD
ncbi:MAG: DNA-directed RNA polymerase subunit beta' [Candidatus Eisenbacteria bacterium]|nr:DNA-directed RNA polymerase subunit beta' [Candidatus Eisenbacteria bacterium]